MQFDDFLKIKYVPNGRDPTIGLDCYGGVRLVRHHLFGKPMMPDYTTVDGSDKAAMTEAMSSEAASWSVVKPRAGAVVTAWRGRLCIHIAIVVEVDGRLMILEWDYDTTYPRLVRPEIFERKFTKVIYHDN